MATGLLFIEQRIFFQMQQWQQQCFVVDDDGNLIPSVDYWRQQKIKLLSPNARLLFAWLQKRNRRFVTLRQISKCLIPVSLRRIEIIRQLMKELMEAGFVENANKAVYYSGYWRKECWEILQTNKK